MSHQHVLDKLRRIYEGRESPLRFNNPFELLVATILSAQCTDERVNQITENLFKRYPDPKSLCRASIDDIAKEIRSCGLYRNKSRYLRDMACILVEKYDGVVPRERDSLESLPGVGRKTASVVLSNAFGMPAIAVDTHVFRTAHRLGLASGKTPERVEKELEQVIPEEDWAEAHHWLLFHGKELCTALNPQCDSCDFSDKCRWLKEREQSS